MKINLFWKRILNISKAVHYESNVSFIKDSVHGIVVKKKYRGDVECIAWLNRHLSRYYDPARALPVAQHEFAALKLLESYGFTPKPIQLDSDSIVMEFAGVPLANAEKMKLGSYLEQCNFILGALRKLCFRHNDLVPGNVLVHEGKIKIIDFTLSEFNGIETMKYLPDQGWARPGQDQKILTYFSIPREGQQKGIGNFLER